MPKLFRLAKAALTVPPPIPLHAPGPYQPVGHQRARVSDRPGTPRRFANDALNSRVAADLARRAFRVRWQLDLGHEVSPNLVLSALDRIVLQGDVVWQVLDDRGAEIVRGATGLSDLVIATDHGALLLVDRGALLTSLRLDDGVFEYQSLLKQGDIYQRTFLGHRGRRLFAVGYERQLSDEDELSPTPNTSLAEAFTVSEPPQVSSSLLLLDPFNERTLMTDTLSVLAAHQEGTLVLAMQDMILWLDLELSIQAHVEGRFLPQAMSLDESCRAHIVASTDGGEVLLRVDERGQRTMAFPIPPGTGPILHPPIIGYDHTVHLLSSGMCVAVGADGAIRWARPAHKVFAGAVITSNDQLVVTDGSEVVSFDAQGQRTVLFSVAGEELRTPPAFSESGELLVASSQRLYALAAG